MCKRGEKILVIGVSRGNEYSPNHVDNDAAILRLAAEALERMGCEVTIYPEKEFVAQNIEGEFIFDMARDRATIERLKKLEDGGALVVNSAYGIDNCVRQQMTELLVKCHIPGALLFLLMRSLLLPCSLAGLSEAIRMPW